MLGDYFGAPTGAPPGAGKADGTMGAQEWLLERHGGSSAWGLKGWRLLRVALLASSMQLPSAWAEPSPADRAAAQVLFDEGRSLMAAQHYAEACPKLEESARLVRGIGAQFNLADCYEKQGKTASAWAGFLAAAAAARAAGQPEREQAARARASALESRLAKVKVEVPPELARRPGLLIKRDGDLVGTSQWGLPIPVDPGEHTVTATLAGYVPWSRTTAVVAGQLLSVPVPELTTEPAAGPSPMPSASAAPAALPVAPPPAAQAPTQPSSTELRPATQITPAPPDAQFARSRGGVQRNIGRGVALSGVVGLGVGTVLGLRAISKKNAADPNCNSSNKCTQDGLDLRDQAVHAGNQSTVAFIAGGALMAVGAVVYFTAPKAKSPSAMLRVSPTVSGSGAGLDLRGQW